MRLLAPAFSNFFSTKRLKLYILSISLFSGFMIAMLYSFWQIDRTFSDKIQNNIKNRVICIDKSQNRNEYHDLTEKDIESILEIKEIESVYKRLNSFSMDLENIGNFPISYLSDQEIQDIGKNSLFSSLQECQIILPEKILDENRQYIFLNDLIGKYVKLTVEEFEVSAKVCGTYPVQNYERTIYVNQTLKEEIVNYNEELEIHKELYAIINHYNSIDNVFEELTNKGYTSYLKDKSGMNDIKIYHLTTIIIIGIFIFSILFVYIFIGMIITGIINDEKLDIAILKAIGYKMKDISKIIGYRVMAIIGISAMIGVILSWLLNKAITFVIHYKLNFVIGNDISLYVKILLIFFLLISIISFISIKINSLKIRKINIIELLKEN